MFAESNAIPWGVFPLPPAPAAETVSITSYVSVLITEMLSSPQFRTYILLFSESNAMERGLSPTDIVATTPSSANASGGE